jgi:hypothetical protein
MIRFFRSPQPAALFVIPFITILLWIQAWNELPVFNGGVTAPLWSMLVPFFSALPSWLNGLIMVGTVSGGAIYFNLLINKSDVLYKNSYMPSLMYVLLSSALLPVLQVHPLHFINLLLLRLLAATFSFFKKEKAIRQIFNGGFLVSVIVLLYLPLLPLLFFYLVVIGLMRTFDVREWLTALVGMLLPVFFLAVWWFPDTLINQCKLLLDYSAHYKVPGWKKFSVHVYWLTGYLVVLLLFALIRLRSHYYKNIVRTRLYQQSILLLLLFSVAALYLMEECRPANFLLLVVPMAVVLAYYFISSKRKMWMYEFMLWGIVGLILWNHTNW